MTNFTSILKLKLKLELKSYRPAVALADMEFQRPGTDKIIRKYCTTHTNVTSKSKLVEKI